MTTKTGIRLLLSIVAIAIAACVAVFGWMKLAPRSVPSGQPAFATLGADSLPSFREAFNAGEVRVLVMLSPT